MDSKGARVPQSPPLPEKFVVAVFSNEIGLEPEMCHDVLICPAARPPAHIRRHSFAGVPTWNSFHGVPGEGLKYFLAL